MFADTYGYVGMKHGVRMLEVQRWLDSRSKRVCVHLSFGIEERCRIQGRSAWMMIAGR